MSVCGIDIGTTGCKISAFTEGEGRYLDSVYTEYDVVRNGGCHELDAYAVFCHIKRMIKEITEKCGEITAIGVTSLGESFVPLDENDNMLHRAMIYTDQRGEEECAELLAKIPEQKIAATVGVKPHMMFSLPKLMWLKKNRPDVFDKAVYFPLMQDYIVYMLSGAKQIDYSLAGRTMGFDMRNKCWWKEIFDAAGLDIGKMSKPVPAGTPAGKIRPEIAKELGVSEDILVVTGCQDQIGAVIGAGTLDSGTAMLGMGTVACVSVVLDEMPEDFAFYDAGYTVVPHPDSKKFVCYALSYACGSMLKWYRDNIVKHEAEAVAASGGNMYKELDMRAPKGPTGLFVLPYFSGAATPYMDAYAKGAIVGLTLENTADDLYRAFMEGVAYEMRLNLYELSRYGIKVDSLSATGGGATSRVWLQIMSNILGITVESLSVKEIGATGTAILSGIAAGTYSDIKEMNGKIIGEKFKYTPDSVEQKEYDRLFENYRKVYGSVKPLA